MQLFAEKGDFSNKKRPKSDPKSGSGLLRDLGLPKRDPVGSSAHVWDSVFFRAPKLASALTFPSATFQHQGSGYSFRGAKGSSNAIYKRRN